MSIQSLGLDLTQVSRVRDVFERRGDRFLARVFTDGERAYCDLRERSRWTHYAGRFAVKEAVMKTLGTGWGKGVRWVDIEVSRERGQAPQLHLHGEAARVAERAGIARIHITITHDAGVAAAVAIAERD